MKLSLKLVRKPAWKHILKPVIVFQTVLSVSSTTRLFAVYDRSPPSPGHCSYPRLAKRLLQRDFRTVIPWANFCANIFAYICQTLSLL